MRGNLPLIGLAGMALLTAGCAVPIPKPKDINEERGLGPNNSVILGSASRSINTTEIKPGSKPGQVDPKRVVCAEPSPDVATTLAQSITASVNAAAQVQSADGASKAIQAAGQFGQSSVQGALQLAERLTTVTLLRDSLHRACEAYANGALSDMSYSLILSRYHATMVTLLNSELMAGAFGRELGALTGEASHALGGMAEEVTQAQSALQAAENDANAKTKAVADAQKALAESPEAEKEAKGKLLIVAQENARKANSNVFLARADLEAARLKGASGRARIDAINVKAIKADVSPDVAEKLVVMTKQLNESGIPEAMTVACITAMDRTKDAYERQGKLAAKCEEYFAGMSEAVKAGALALGKLRADPELEKKRMEGQFDVQRAQIRANIARDISRLCSSQQTPKERQDCITSVQSIMELASTVGSGPSPRPIASGGAGGGNAPVALPLAPLPKLPQVPQAAGKSQPPQTSQLVHPAPLKQ
ncbi:MAG: hypothetical protein L6R19_28010 [Alphaproteobacteria bacterium]|nr:hypothetical protein [Alphaproteobacteria bacterium]